MANSFGKFLAFCVRSIVAPRLTLSSTNVRLICSIHRSIRRRLRERRAEDASILTPRRPLMRMIPHTLLPPSLPRHQSTLLVYLPAHLRKRRNDIGE